MAFLVVSRPVILEKHRESAGIAGTRWPERRSFGALACLLLATALAASAEDWPTYQHDNRRSGVTSERLTLPLGEAWRYVPVHAPRPAWPEPARFDLATNTSPPLQARVTYDRVFHVAIAGDAVYFASSADDKVYALDAATGGEQWSFFTGGPVRLAPSVFDGRVYVGSDDGFAYCLGASDGAVVWKYAPAPNGRYIPGNNRIMSVRPIRTSVLVQNGIAYLGAGLFPREGVYLCALDARTGKEIWKSSPDPVDFIRRFSSAVADRDFGFSPQGYLLASNERLYAPIGRTTPAIIDIATGDVTGLLACPVREGGTYAVLAGESIVSGPGTQLRVFNTPTQDPVASYAGRCIIVTDAMSFLLSDTAVSAVDRARFDQVTAERNALTSRGGELRRTLRGLRRERGQLSGAALEELEARVAEMEKESDALKDGLKDLEGREYVWTTPCRDGCTMILASDVLFIGGDGVVTALRVSDGEPVWSAKVAGKAYGLAAANGRLFASTDTGTIHCFNGKSSGDLRSVSPATAKSPFPEDGLADAYATAAQRIIDVTGVTAGYCVDLGCGEGRLAYELARRTNLQIVAVDDNEENVAQVRAALDRAGLYGARVTAQVASLESLPLSDCVANLIVSDRSMISGEIPTSAEEVMRLVRPHGGTAVIGRIGQGGAPAGRDALERWAGATAGWEIADEGGLYAFLRRGPVPGGGEWTHQYADPGNSACSPDTAARAPMALQWFGLPGPRPMVDRHHRAMPPLAKDGRLFVPGDNRVFAVDAYNGTPLWDIETPGSRRIAAQRDAGNMAVTEDYLYAAVQGECWGLDVATGRRGLTFPVPQHVKGQERRWGYVGSVDDLLFGSGQKQDANYTKIGMIGDYEIQWNDFKRIVTCDYLFCLDRHTGEERWSYENGAIIHPTITIGDGRVYFVESLNPAAREDPLGRSTLEALLGGGARLVALDMRTGEPAWAHTVDLALYQHVIYLSYAQDTLLALGSGNREDKAWYYLRTFDAATGAPLWQADHGNNRGGIGGDHGEQIHHPVIAGDVVFAEPVAYDLHTGARVDLAGAPSDWVMDRRSGCGTLSGSGSFLMYRDCFPCIQPLEPGGRREPLNYVSRTGCWINMIAAGGIVLVPEASSGCSCPHPLQTSLAYISRSAHP